MVIAHSWSGAGPGDSLARQVASWRRRSRGSSAARNEIAAPPALPTSADSAELVQTAKAPQTFEAFFTAYEHQVFGYLVRMLGDEQVARDLSQEAFLRAWQHFTQISAYDHPSSWLFRVATNLAISHLRRRSSPVGAAKSLEDDEGPARSDPGMRRVVENDLVERVLLDLTPKQRAVLVLREICGLSSDEVALSLGMSRDAVKMALWRAREQFRARYTLRGGRL